MRRKKLIWQLYLSYLVIVLISLVAVTWYTSHVVQRFAFARATEDLAARAHLAGEAIRGAFLAGDTAAVDSLCKRLGGNSGTRITIVRPSGHVIGDSDDNPATMSNHADRPEVRAALAGETGTSTRYSSTLRQTLMYVALPLGDGERILGVVRCSFPFAPVGREIYGVYGRTIIGALVIAGLIAVFSFGVSRRISRPLEEMKFGAERFARGELGHRVAVPESDELGWVAEALNQMAFQLDERIRAITDQRNERDAILASMVEGVLAVDTEQRVININRAACRMLDVNVPDCGGRSVQEVLRATPVQDFVARALGAEEPVEGELELRGGERVLRANGAALRDGRGNRLGAVIVLNDVTQLRRLETVRRDFVANVSHELKTPITSLKGFVETLLNGAVNRPADARRFLDIISRQIDRLNAIIDDLLLLSSLEQDGGKHHLSFEERRLVDVLASAVEVCGPRAAQKEVSLHLDCPEALAWRVNPHLLEQAVVNLVDNAIKYSELRNAVWVTAELAPDGVVIRVRDRGCGIPEEHQSRLFERFYRVDRARSRKLGGTGLGLAIVKHIAQVHGGDVIVDSTVGQGSIFSIHLPSPHGTP